MIAALLNVKGPRRGTVSHWRGEETFTAFYIKQADSFSMKKENRKVINKELQQLSTKC